MKTALAWLSASLVGVFCQFGIFLFAYKKLTFPYLHEEQRVENAPYICGYVLPAILLVTLISVFVFYLLSKNRDNT
jgi:hypothetical protein